MNPIAFTIFGFEIRWYGVIIAFAMMLCSVLMLKLTKQDGFKEDDIYDAIIICIPSSIIGARLYYVIFNWSYYGSHLDQIINTRGGGLAIHGGLLFGVLSTYLVCRYKKINFFSLVDSLAIVLPLGQAIGRWGNFMNGEAHGGPTDLPWAISVAGEKVHPTFLYESIWNILLFILLLKFRGKKKFNGEIFLWYIGIYSMGRFFIEGLRTDSLMFFGLRAAQLLSIGLIVISSILIFVFRKKFK